MKKYLVIGNPIEHSLSPKLHNYWIKKNNIKAVFEKKQLNENDIKNIIYEVKNETINGINVTLPFKKSVIPFVDRLSPEAIKTQSVNTIYKENNKVVGHNTDIGGFELAIKNINYDIKNKKIFILGAGGVVPSIILALKKMKASKIILSNRTKKKAESLKNFFSYLEIVDWGKIPDFNMIINATSVGLKKGDDLKLDYADIGPNKLFYDVIYNPNQTKFLSMAKEFGNKIENGKMMFIYQAHQSFTIWHKKMPEIDDETISLLD
jgi:shikimate dehydrogenase|tara:strand:- start:251 stop:1042 length:792 start_codon:yes stop_codon:yes gene_type:complete